MKDEDLGKLAYRHWVRNHYVRTHAAPGWHGLPDIIQRGWIAVAVGIRDELRQEMSR